MVRFMLWGVPVLLGACAPEPVRLRMAKRFRMPLLEDKRAIRLMLRGQFDHPPRIPRLAPFTDDELRSITTPTTVLVGARTEPFDAREVVDRARDLIPEAVVAEVPDAGHAFPVDHLDVVLASVEQIDTRPAVGPPTRRGAGPESRASPLDRSGRYPKFMFGSPRLFFPVPGVQAPPRGVPPL